MLKPGQYDLLKGSFYATMLSRFLQSQGGQAAAIDPPNVWPATAMLPGFQETFEDLCTLIIDVGAHVARACDRFASEHVPEYEAGALERVVKTSRTHRARLLHYFPVSQLATADETKTVEEADEDDWCALHLDDGCLTGLTSALFVDESGDLPSVGDKGPDVSTMPILPKSPDPKAGLYIQSRTGAVVKVNIPSDCLAFQTGESLEMMTSGKLKAVPHFVRGPSKKTKESTSRNTLALFMQPNSGDIVDRRTGMTFGEFTKSVDERYAS
jgi:isopenicillin N synthase-like dioxygenase